MRLYQHLTTSHDRNGKPRRLWIFYEAIEGQDQANVTMIVDEVCSDTPIEILGAVELEDITIPASEYREFVKFAKLKGIFRNG